MATKAGHSYSSRWALALFGAALLLVIFLGMIRELTERLSLSEG